MRESIAFFASGDPFLKLEYSASGVPVLAKGDVKPFGRVEHSDARFIPESLVAARGYRTTHPGDYLLTTRDLTQAADFLGLLAAVPQDQVYLVNQGANVVRFHPSVEERFLVYWCNGPVYRAHMKGHHVGSTQIHIRKEDFLDAPLWLPSRDEQRTIAHILGTLDDKIELNRRMAATLEAMARALFKSWFVDFDPVRAKAEGRETGLPEHVASLFPDSFEDAELGSVPAGWGVGSVGALAERVMDRATVWHNEPLIDLGRMPKGRIALESWGLGSELKTSVTRFRTEDTLFGAIRPYFHKVGCAPIDGVTNTSVFVLRSRRKEDWPFTAMVCSRTDTVQYATRMARGTKMPVVSWPDLERYQVVLPPTPTRDAFNRPAGQLLDRIMAAMRECRTLEETRGTLLPKLISGEVRVAVAENLLGERAS